MKRKYPIKFLFDMRGFWADERVDGEIWNLKSRFSSGFIISSRKRTSYFLSADASVSLTYNGKNEIFMGLHERCEMRYISYSMLCRLGFFQL